MSEGELRSLKVKGGVSFYMVEEKGSLQVRKEDDLLGGGTLDDPFLKKMFNWPEASSGFR